MSPLSADRDVEPQTNEKTASSAYKALKKWPSKIACIFRVGSAGGVLLFMEEDAGGIDNKTSSTTSTSTVETPGGDTESANQ